MYFDFHLIHLDRGGDLDGLDVVDYYGHDVAQHFQCVVHHYFDVADLAAVDVFADVLTHVVLGVTIEPLLHELDVAVHVIGDVVHVALYVYAFCCSDVVAEIYHLFQHVHERLVSQVTVKYKRYLIELAQLPQQQVRLLDRTVRGLLRLYSPFAQSQQQHFVLNEIDQLFALVFEQTGFLTMHMGLLLFEQKVVLQVELHDLLFSEPQHELKL
ncbi:hypothetical protein AMPH_10657 [Acinetobacter baumannii]|nr:hypothetical protein AMPH_10657 [Acinetobacter baumannii]